MGWRGEVRTENHRESGTACPAPRQGGVPVIKRVGTPNGVGRASTNQARVGTIHRVMGTRLGGCNGGHDDNV